MRRAAVALLVLVVPAVTAQDPIRTETDAALQEALAAEEGRQLSVEIRFGDAAGGESEVEFGAEFAVTVVRRWPTGLELPPWDDRALVPLIVEPRTVERREADGRIVETRRFVARTFRRGAVTVHVDEPRTVFVRSSLPDDDPGEIELPAEPMPAPSPWWPLIDRALLAGLGIATLGWLGLWAFRRGSDRPRQMPTADREVLLRLDALRGHAPATADEHRADAVETAAIIRTYLAARFDLDAPGLTTDEFTTTGELVGEHRTRVDAFLTTCDRVKFARHRTSPDEREALLAAIRAFVEDTRLQEVVGP